MGEMCGDVETWDKGVINREMSFLENLIFCVDKGFPDDATLRSKYAALISHYPSMFDLGMTDLNMERRKLKDKLLAAFGKLYQKAPPRVQSQELTEEKAKGVSQVTFAAEWLKNYSGDTSEILTSTVAAIKAAITPYLAITTANTVAITNVIKVLLEDLTSVERRHKVAASVYSNKELSSILKGLAFAGPEHLPCASEILACMYEYYGPSREDIKNLKNEDIRMVALHDSIGALCLMVTSRSWPLSPS